MPMNWNLFFESERRLSCVERPDIEPLIDLLRALEIRQVVKTTMASTPRPS